MDGTSYLTFSSQNIVHNLTKSPRRTRTEQALRTSTLITRPELVYVLTQNKDCNKLRATKFVYCILLSTSLAIKGNKVVTGSR